MWFACKDLCSVENTSKCVLKGIPFVLFSITSLISVFLNLIKKREG